MASDHQQVHPVGVSSSAVRWQLVAWGLALLSSGALLLAPMGTSTTEGTDSTGATISSTTHPTLVQSQGSSVLWLLAVPVLLTGIPLLARRRRAVAVICTVLLGFAVLVAMLSIGVFYLPALVCAVIAAVRAAGAQP